MERKLLMQRTREGIRWWFGNHGAGDLMSLAFRVEGLGGVHIGAHRTFGAVAPGSYMCPGPVDNGREFVVAPSHMVEDFVACREAAKVLKNAYKKNR